MCSFDGALQNSMYSRHNFLTYGIFQHSYSFTNSSFLLHIYLLLNASCSSLPDMSFTVKLAILRQPHRNTFFSQRPSSVFLNHPVKLVHQAARLSQYCNDLLVMPEFSIIHLAPLAILQPLLANLLTTD